MARHRRCCCLPPHTGCRPKVLSQPLVLLQLVLCVPQVAFVRPPWEWKRDEWVKEDAMLTMQMLVAEVGQNRLGVVCLSCACHFASQVRHPTFCEPLLSAGMMDQLLLILMNLSVSSPISELSRGCQAGLILGGS